MLLERVAPSTVQDFSECREGPVRVHLRPFTTFECGDISAFRVGAKYRPGTADILKVHVVSPTFRERFTCMTEKPVKAEILQISEMTREGDIAQIRPELGVENTEITLGQHWQLHMLQGQGQSGRLLTEGVNIGFILDRYTESVPVCSIWIPRLGWNFTDCFSLSTKWKRGTRIISRDYLSA
jgi:hypothetical protein